MFVNVTITGDAEILSSLDRLPDAINEALYKKVTILALKLEAGVKTGKLNGQVLNRITGALSRSIQNEVTRKQGQVIGRVFSAGDVKYAAIHEFGGVINHPGGTAYIANPKREGLVMFVSNKNATSDMRRTKPHTIKMPERSFLRSKFREMSQEISLGTKEAVVQTIRRELG